MNRREALKTFIAGAVYPMVSAPTPRASVGATRYQVALWLLPARQYQWQIWEIVSYLSANYSSPDRRIPIFPPHATLYTGYLDYDSQEELEDKRKQLFQRVKDFCERQTRPLSFALEDPPNQFGCIDWWSQFFHYKLKSDRWPKLEPAMFKPLADVQPPISHKDKSLMPHVSLMYCPTASVTDFKGIDFSQKVKDRFPNLPDHIDFDAISIVTPDPNDWDAIVTKPPQQWQVIYTRPFGSAPAGGGLKKVVAGGQTGVDTAALRAAWSGGLAIGGWAPPDGQNLDGKIPIEFLLTNTAEERSPGAAGIRRSLRTQRNARDSDATLILRRFNDDDSWEFSPDAITIPDSVAASLVPPTNPLLAWLWDQFDAHDRKTLEELRHDPTKTRELQSLLAASFNKAVRNSTVSEMHRYANYKLSDATTALLQDGESCDTSLLKRRLLEDALPEGFNPVLDPGTLYTAWAAIGFGKPVLMWDPGKDKGGNIDKVVDWIKRNNVRQLNVGGPAQQTVPGIGEAAYNFLSQLFARARSS